MSLSAALVVAVPLAVPVAVNAQTANSPITGQVCTTANGDFSQTIPSNLGSTGSTTCTVEDTTSNFNNIITKIINILSVIVGVIAVIMIVVGGFRYITSGGSSEKVTAAKNTILYALIGLIIVALAQVIVRFVLQKTTQAT